MSKGMDDRSPGKRENDGKTNSRVRTNARTNTKSK